MGVILTTKEVRINTKEVVQDLRPYAISTHNCDPLEGNSLIWYIGDVDLQKAIECSGHLPNSSQFTPSDLWFNPGHILTDKQTDSDGNEWLIKDEPPFLVKWYRGQRLEGEANPKAQGQSLEGPRIQTHEANGNS